MTLDEMHQPVNAELACIPRHPKEHQSQLQVAYTNYRKRDLGKKGDPSRTWADALRDAFAYIREKHPDAELHYDVAFFGVE